MNYKVIYDAADLGSAWPIWIMCLLAVAILFWIIRWFFKTPGIENFPDARDLVYSPKVPQISDVYDKPEEGALRLAAELSSDRNEPYPSDLRAKKLIGGTGYSGGIIMPILFLLIAPGVVLWHCDAARRCEQENRYYVVEGTVDYYTGGAPWEHQTIKVDGNSFQVPYLSISQGDKVKIWYAQDNHEVIKVARLDQTPKQ